MLTSDLLVTRTYKGKIEPVYAALDAGTVGIARSVMDLFQGHVGKTYGSLLEEIEELEEVDYRLIRGLAQLLERRCAIEMDSDVDPVAARREVFEECRGIVTDAEERQKVMERVADRLSITPENLEKALWADREENLVIREFNSVSPEDLLRQYNLSLTQTLLFRASGMEIQIDGNYQPIFRKIKQLGLMYSIEQGKIYLDGPVSLFKLTERYGTAYAKLLPAIIRADGWSLKASIVRKTMQGKRVLEFSLDNTRQVFNTGIAEETFDSAIEKEFSALNFNGWQKRREPAVLRAGQYAFIPDFSLERGGNRIYVEIIGFWTPEYLRKKVQKINLLKENIILLVDKNLACAGMELRAENILYYNRKIPYLDIIKILRRYEEKQFQEELEKTGNIEIHIEGSVIELGDIAGKYNINKEVLKRTISRKNGDHLLFGDQLVSRKTLDDIKNQLSGIRKHSEALRIIGRHGIKGHCSVLEFLGYRVKWSGLDPENAEITS